MIYVTVKQGLITHQMTLEELLFQDDAKNYVISSDTTNTKTYAIENERFHDSKFYKKSYAESLTRVLQKFNREYAELYNVPREKLYRTFHIPKRSGGLRRIDAPNDELMTALRRLKDIFENSFHALYHTSAFAYVKGRNTVSCIKRHQENQSRWFAKFDLHDFFGSTTKDFVIRMFSMIWPFSEVIRYPKGKEELEKALDLAFLNGGLPQGTPISPTITNIMMIPIDFALANELRDVGGQRFVYTRYADDFQISSRYDFKFREIEDIVVKKLEEFGAPFTLNRKKTRYGSSAGANWNLGLMLNSNNEITVGHKAKRKLQAMLSSYIMDKKNGIQWDVNDVQVMDGYLNYCRSIEREVIHRIEEHLNNKFGVDLEAMIHNDLRS